LIDKLKPPQSTTPALFILHLFSLLTHLTSNDGNTTNTLGRISSELLPGFRQFDPFEDGLGLVTVYVSAQLAQIIKPKAKFTIDQMSQDLTRIHALKFRKILES
jgi:hypothetical protein